MKLGHVSLDGTKVRANASKHKAMSYGRMPGALAPDGGPARCAGEKKRAELETRVKELIARADAVDAEEDAKYGRGKRGDPKSLALRGELPEELRFRETRLAKIKEAMAELEAEAKAEAEVKRAEIAEKEEKRRENEERTGKGTGHGNVRRRDARASRVMRIPNRYPCGRQRRIAPENAASAYGSPLAAGYSDRLLGKR